MASVSNVTSGKNAIEPQSSGGLPKYSRLAERRILSANLARISLTVLKVR